MHATLRALAFSMATAAAASAGAADVTNIADYGDDGDARYYQVRCSDNRLVSVRIDAEPGSAERSACYYDRNDEEQCIATWDIRAAAEQACE